MNFKLPFILFLTSLVLFSEPLKTFAQEPTAEERVVVDCNDAGLRSQAFLFFSRELQGNVTRSMVSEAIRKFHAGKSIYLVQVFQMEGVEPRYRVVVQSKPRVAEIEVPGAKRVDPSDLISKLNITAGDPITPDALLLIENKIREYYAYRGFRRAEVKATIQEAGGAGLANLFIKVKEGPPCHISKLNLEVENGKYDLEEIQKWLGMKVGNRCDLERIATGGKRIEEHFRKQEKLASSVETPSILWDEEKNQASLELKISIGPKIHIRFIGNTFFFERNSVLEQAIFLNEEHHFNKTWIESTAVDGILRFYRAEGYPDAKVIVKDENRNQKEERWITFFIDRGNKIHISSVHFSGIKKVNREDVEDAFWSAALESTQSKAYVPEDVEVSVQGVLAFYQSQGFLRTTVSPHKMLVNTKKQSGQVQFDVDEGSQSKLAKLNITGNRLFTTAQLEEWMGVKPGDPIDPVQLLKSEESIREKYRASGYKFASVTGPTLESIPEGKVNFNLQIEEGPVVHFGEVIIKGNLHTQDKVIRREMKMSDGEPYSPEKLRNSRRNLLRLGFFQQISVEESNFDPITGKEDVIVTVNERKKRSIRFRPGYSSDVGARAALDLSYINIAGTGRSASVSGEISKKVSGSEFTAHREVFSYREPKIFNFMDGRLNFINERSEEVQFNINRRSLILGVDREWLSWLRTAVQWELEFRDPFDVQPNVTLSPFDEKSAKFGSISTIFDFDLRNDFLNPTAGSYHRLKFDYYNENLLSDADFMQVYARDTFYIPIYKRIRMVSAVRIGFSTTYGKTSAAGISEVPIEKRFRLGGSASLRGFSRNCVGGSAPGVPEQCNNDPKQRASGGNAVFNYMNDLLFPIYGSLDLALFSDGGNAFVQNNQFDITNIRTTAGVGLRYNTFFGPMRLDVGFKLDRRTGESLTEVSFAVGQF